MSIELKSNIDLHGIYNYYNLYQSVNYSIDHTIIYYICI